MDREELFEMEQIFSIFPFFGLCISAVARLYSSWQNPRHCSTPRSKPGKKNLFGKGKQKEKEESKMKFLALVVVFLAVSAPVFGRISNLQVNKINTPAPEVDLCPTCVRSDQKIHN
jgi:hypothetical protein